MLLSQKLRWCVRPRIVGQRRTHTFGRAMAAFEIDVHLQNQSEGIAHIPVGYVEGQAATANQWHAFHVVRSKLHSGKWLN